MPPGKIYNSNAIALCALARAAGAEVTAERHVPDDLDATCQALKELADSGVDAIISAGGVSVGARDFIKPALELLGRLEMWRVAMKPGKPVVFGSIDRARFFGLPGNPASAQVTFELFVRPCLQKMAGRTDLYRPLVEATLLDAVDHEPGRREYVRAVTVWRDGRYYARTTGEQGSGRMASMLGANSLIVVSEESRGVLPGASVSVMLTDSR